MDNDIRLCESEQILRTNLFVLLVLNQF